jgi:transmembrane sensor
MDIQELREYLKSLADDTLTDEGYQQLESWIAGCNRKEYEQMLEMWEEYVNASTKFEEASEELLARIANSMSFIGQPAQIVKIATGRKWWMRFAVAASILIFLSIAVYFSLVKIKKENQERFVANDIAPGTEHALLKTANGRHVMLDVLPKGIIKNAANGKINKSGDQFLTFASSTSESDDMVYDTIEIPAGGKPYKIILGDGSKILLNVATTLKIPENNSLKMRGELELISGEIYADIHHNNSWPLKIKAPGQLISDLGTKFDVKAYTNEEAQTTLEEGSVLVNKKVLIPGKAAVTNKSETVVKNADVEQTVAWTKGYFRFNGENIETIMKELSHWYDIDVVYEGKITTEGFYGKISRSKNISEVLKMLEKTKFVHFKIQGRRVTVSSKN